MNDTFRLYDFGPVKTAEVEFGDLTFLVGPQASGKSIFLQAWKLARDWDSIVRTMDSYSYVTSTRDDVVRHYFGIRNLRAESIELQSASQGKIFYIPAQRVMSISDGRPKNFSEFEYETPYVMREFSEYLRRNFGPYAEEMAEKINNPSSIYHGAKIEIDTSMGQKKMRLNVDGTSIAFVSWSAGQKEYMPFGMANYFINRKSGPTVFRPSLHKSEFACAGEPSDEPINDYSYIVIEEPEMGLHTQAIVDFLKEVFRLQKRGYRIAISTHSSVFMDFVWYMSKFHDATLDEFNRYLSKALGLTSYFDFSDAYYQRDNIKTYFFNAGISKDISSLDAMSDDGDVADWGGITDFSSRISDLLSDYRNSKGEVFG